MRVFFDECARKKSQKKEGVRYIFSTRDIPTILLFL